MEKKTTKRRVPKVSIILPTYNEEKSVGKMIKEIKKMKKNFTYEIVVADGGSKDKTVKIAKEEKVKVFEFGKKRGKGVDFRDAALKSLGDYIVQIDADYQFKPTEIQLLVDELDKGADIAIGKRVDQADAPLIRTLGNFLLSMATSVAAGKYISDSLAGFKAIKRKKFIRLKIKEHHFGYEAETVIKSARLGYKLVEVPVSYHRRNTGHSQVSPLRDGWLILKSIIKAGIVKL